MTSSVWKILLPSLLPAVLLGSVGFSRPALAQTPFLILGQPVFTLSQPETGTQARVDGLENRFNEILGGLTSPRLEISTAGNEEAASLRLNDQVLLLVTLADAEANGGESALSLAEAWATRLEAVLNQPAVQRQLLATLGLPRQIALGGRTYQVLPEPTTDIGRFVTDGQRAGGQVVFWESLDPGDRQFPQPPPAEVYLLNANRQFVPYR